MKYKKQRSGHQEIITRKQIKKQTRKKERKPHNTHIIKRQKKRKNEKDRQRKEVKE